MVKAHPQAMVDRARLLARYHPLQDVASILGVQPSQITAFKNRGWREGLGGRPPRAMPADFVYFANRMTFGELTRHYRAGNTTVQRWLHEVGSGRKSRRGETLRRDPATGLRVWEARGG